MLTMSGYGRPSSLKRCGSKFFNRAVSLSGLAKNRSQIILGNTMNSSTSHSSHIAVREGTNFCATLICATRSQTALRSGACCTYRVPTSQLSSQSTRRATRPTLLHKCGSTRSKHFSTSRRYSRIAMKDSTTSVARVRAADNALALISPSDTVVLQWCSVWSASLSTSARRSSRPFRRKLATELIRAMQATRRRCSSVYSGMSCNPSWPCSFSMSCILESWLTACKMSLLAFSSISISSAMYLCSKRAHAKSSVIIAARNSDFPTTVAILGFSNA
mmetsp:Transcript_28000/g.73884  ORF Transcript_28000/g.73884 Transcript_28000/m.73884 type:complete len:275 (+) Transcript_28000:930-1754(+)